MEGRIKEPGRFVVNAPAPLDTPGRPDTLRGAEYAAIHARRYLTERLPHHATRPELMLNRLAINMNPKVSDLCRSYVHRSIARYRITFMTVLKGIEKNWIPSADDHSVDSFVADLRKFLVANAEEENDEFLLRFGITVPGIQRGIDPPILVLQENRGGYKEKRQRQSASQVSSLREAIELGRILFTDLPPETPSLIRFLDSVALNRPTVTGEERLAVLSALSENDRNAFSTGAIAFAKNKNRAVRDVGVEMLRDLVCFHQSAIPDSVVTELIELKIYGPGILYRNTGDAIATRLLHELPHVAKTHELNQILSCLAWNQSEVAIAAFMDWSRNPPDWGSNLNVAAIDYSVYGGWAINKTGGPIRLFEEACYRIPVETGPSDASLCCRMPSEKPCISCDGKLSRLFDFRNLNESRLRAIFSGDRSNAPKVFETCLHCSLGGTVFERYKDDKATTRLHPLTKYDFQISSDEIRPIYRSIANEASSPYAAAEPFLLDDASSIGGMPSWLQDADFPRCIDCDEFMLFFGQHDNGSVAEEGIYYAFFCPQCEIFAVNYQQT